MKREATVLLIGKVMQVLLSLVSVRLLTGLLSKEEVCFLYLFLSIISYMGLVFINPVGMFINRKINEWRTQKQIFKNLFIYNIYVLMVAIFSTVFVWLAQSVLGVGDQMDIWVFVLLIALYTYITTWNQTILPFLNLFFFRVSYVVFTVISSVLALMFSFILVESFNASAVYWLIGNLASQLIITFIALVYMWYRLAEPFEFSQVKFQVIKFKEIKNIWSYCLPIGVATLFMWIQDQSYRFVVESSVGLAYLAMIAVGLNLSKSIYSSIESLVHQVFFPIYYKEINDLDTANRSFAWSKMASIIIPIYTSLLVFVCVMAPFLTRVLLDEKFYSVFYFVIFGAGIEFFRVVTNLLSSIAHSEYSTKSVMKPYVYGGLTTLVGTYFVVHVFHFVDGILYILLAAGLLTIIVMYNNMRKLLTLSLNIRILKLSIVLSCPLLIAALFYHYSNHFVPSLIILAIIGCYYIAAIYYLFQSYSKMYNNQVQRV